MTGPPGAPSDRPAGLGLNRAVSGGRVVVVAVEVASLVSLTSGHPGGRRLSGSLAKLSGRFPRSPPVFAGGDFKELQAGSIELRWRIVISFLRCKNEFRSFLNGVFRETRSVGSF